MGRLGENDLSLESVQVVADVLRASDAIVHLGYDHGL